ncbi:hypothetical protein Hanom_Chr05g00447541 [Helianthus anomalus]
MKWLFCWFLEGDGTGLLGSPSMCARVSLSLISLFTFSLLHTIANLESQKTIRQSTHDVLLYCIFHTAATVNSD